MNTEKLKSSLDKFTDTKKVIRKVGNQTEECDLVTGECYVVREKDGIVERINKKYVIEDGRQLLQD